MNYAFLAFSQRRTRTAVCGLLAAVTLSIPLLAQSENESFKLLFDGKTFDGWNGDTENTWRIENECIVAGNLQKPARRNEFIATDQSFGDFELQLKFKIKGDVNVNAGVQFRTKRIPNHHEVSGYQADIGPGWYGKLYDESRRNKVLAGTTPQIEKRAVAAVAEDGWHTYRIRAIGNHIQLWLNGVKTVEYHELDDSVDREGIIALQIHGSMQAVIMYKDIRICELSDESSSIVN